MEMNRRWIGKVEWTAAVLLTLVILSLLTIRVIHAGGLWRDECAVVQLARMPTFTDVLKNFQHEAFPPPFHALIRAYSNCFGTSDAAFRTFGFAIVAALIAVLWFNARLLYRGPPLLSLFLLGLNTSVLIWATTIRGYGLGCVLILLAFGLIARALLQPQNAFWVWGAFLASIASIHCLLYNSVLLLAMGVSAMLVFIRRRKWKSVSVVMGLCVLAGLSVLPYVGPYSSGKEWNVLVKTPVDFHLLWTRFNWALGSPTLIMSWVWRFFLFVAIGGTVWRLWKNRADNASPERDLLLFGLVTLMLSLVGYYIFLKMLSYKTYPWYYLALMSILAAAMDLLVEKMAHIGWVRVVRLGCLIVAMLLLPFAARPDLILRQTNTDLVAHQLERDAKPADLIVVAPWFYGVSFNWYYHGAAPWVTLPMISEHRTHRYDLVKAKMTSAAPLADLQSLIARTLQSGGRVWVVGDNLAVNLPPLLLKLPPAPSPQFGWDEGRYETNWKLQISSFLQQHAPSAKIIDVSNTGPVMPFEVASLLVVEGWRGDRGSNASSR